MEKPMNEPCYAKVNLALDVFNVRADGYHDIKSVMVPVSFYDEIDIRIADKTSYLCDKWYLKFNEANSIVKMINSFTKMFDINDHYQVYLKKLIPTKAGLAGGTSDAAGALRILQRIYHRNLTDEQIKDLCLSVGADVYFNYYNRPAVVSGIGDKLDFINIVDDYYVLLVKPREGVSTKEAYGLLDMDKCDHPDIDGLVKALENGEDILPFMSNSLEQPALILNSEIASVKRKLMELGAPIALMSGSGSTVFTISKNRAEIELLYEKIKNYDYFVRMAKIINY